MRIKPLNTNMTELEFPNARILFSYSTPVAACIAGACYRTAQFWSRTTSRHISKWLDGAQATERPQEFFDELVASCTCNVPEG